MFPCVGLGDDLACAVKAWPADNIPEWREFEIVLAAKVTLECLLDDGELRLLLLRHVPNTSIAWRSWLELGPRPYPPSFGTLSGWHPSLVMSRGLFRSLTLLVLPVWSSGVSIRS